MLWIEKISPIDKINKDASLKTKEDKMEKKQVTREIALEMRAAWEAGETQDSIADRYSDLGYVTVRGQDRLKAYTVCTLIQKYRPRKNTKTFSPPPTEKSLDTFVKKILASGLSKSLKLETINAVL